MSLTLTQEQIAAANAESVTTFYLYEIYYNPVNAPGACLRYTNWQPAQDNPAYPNYLHDNGYTYKTVPIKHSEITQGTDGKVQDFSVSIGNADRIIQGYLENPDYDLMSGKIKIMQVIKGVGSTPPMTFRIKKASCKKDVATFTLSIGVDVLGYEIPGRRLLSRFCWWAFRDSDCKYAGHYVTKVTRAQAGTSTTSNTIAEGPVTVTTQLGLGLSGKRVRLVNTANTSRWMEGDVTSYSGTTLTILVTMTGSSGTYASWDIKLVTSTTTQVIDAECDRTFEDCKSKLNLVNFGGFPGVLNERFYF